MNINQENVDKILSMLKSRYDFNQINGKNFPADDLYEAARRTCNQHKSTALKLVHQADPKRFDVFFEIAEHQMFQVDYKTACMDNFKHYVLYYESSDKEYDAVNASALKDKYLKAMLQLGICYLEGYDSRNNRSILQAKYWLEKAQEASPEQNPLYKIITDFNHIKTYRASLCGDN